MARNRDLGKLPFETLGGTAGQLLSKATATDYDFQWIDNFTSDVEHDVKAGEAVSKGNAVYISNADGTNMIVTKADNTAEGTSSKTIGLMKDTLALNGTGRVITEGLLSGTGSAPLNTSTATIGDPVWLGGSGTLIFGLANKPYAPKHLVFLGVVTRVHSINGEIFVKVQNAFELKEIHDVQARTPSLNDTLYYSSDDNQWKTASIPNILGYTPVTNARTISTTSPLSGGGDLSANRTLSIAQATTSASGYLSSTDWNTFNGKQAALSGSGIVKSTGGTISYLTDNSTNWDSAYTNRITSLTTTGDSGPADLTANVLNIPEYTIDGLGGQPKSVNLTSLSGLSYSSASFVKMTAAGTFSLDTTIYYPVTNPAGFTSNTGTVTSVAALTIGTTGTDITSSVANGTTTPVITLNIPNASATARGVLTYTDWSTFNNKQSALTFSTGLTNTSGTITANLSVGVSGGQSVIGGSASGDSLTLSSTSNATKGKILFGTSAYDESTNRLGLGTASPTHILSIVGGTITETNWAIDITATMPTTLTANNRYGGRYVITGAGSSAFSSNALYLEYSAGYTGSATTRALSTNNYSQSTGSAYVTEAGNMGFYAQSIGTTTGSNKGGYYFASGGDLNIGASFRTTTGKDNAVNVGMLSSSLNTNTGGVYVGGLFMLSTSSPTTLTSCALMCDNSAQAVDIFVARDNGTKVWSIADGGNTTWADAINMAFGTTIGTKIGTATNQKIGFWNAAPIIQPTTAISTSITFTANSGTAVNDASTFGGYTLKQVVQALINIGILA